MINPCIINDISNVSFMYVLDEYLYVIYKGAKCMNINNSKNDISNCSFLTQIKYIINKT